MFKTGIAGMKRELEEFGWMMSGVTQVMCFSPIALTADLALRTVYTVKMWQYLAHWVCFSTIYMYITIRRVIYIYIYINSYIVA